MTNHLRALENTMQEQRGSGNSEYLSADKNDRNYYKGRGLAFPNHLLVHKELASYPVGYLSQPRSTEYLRKCGY